MTTTRSRVDGRTKRQFLLEAKLFAGLGQQELAQIERNTSMSTYQRGMISFTPEETGEVLFLLKRGRVNLYRVTEDGKKLVTATVEPVRVLGGHPARPSSARHGRPGQLRAIPTPRSLSADPSAARSWDGRSP